MDGIVELYVRDKPIIGVVQYQADMSSCNMGKFEPYKMGLYKSVKDWPI